MTMFDDVPIRVHTPPINTIYANGIYSFEGAMPSFLAHSFTMPLKKDVAVVLLTKALNAATGTIIRSSAFG